MTKTQQKQQQKLTNNKRFYNKKKNNSIYSLPLYYITHYNEWWMKLKKLELIWINI